MEILLTSSCGLLPLESETGYITLHQGIRQIHKLHENENTDLTVRHQNHSFLSSQIQGRSSNGLALIRSQVRVYTPLKQWFLCIHQ